MALRPMLRSGVTVEAADGGGATLFDPLLERTLHLGPIAAALVRRFDGRSDAGAIVDAVLAEEPLGDRARVERSLRTLLLVNLVDGAGDAIVRRVARLRAGEEAVPVRFLEEARFACQGSGMCCQSYLFGPLSDDDVARLAAIDLPAAFPELGDEPFWIELDRGGGRQRFLRAVGDNRCVFLQPDLRCGIHARFGAEAKPRFCRLYPWEAVTTLAGRKVYDRGACATFAVSSRSGEPAPEAVLALLGPDDALYHPVVHLADEAPCDYGHFLRLQEAWCDLVARAPGDRVAIVRAVGALGRAFVDRVATCPIDQGEPDATIDRLIAAPPPAPEVDPATSCAALAAAAHLTDDLARLLVHCFAAEEQTLPRSLPLADGRSSAHLLNARLLREVCHVLHLVEAVARHRAEPGSVPLDEHVAVVAAVAWDPALDEAVRVSLRQQLFGHAALIERRPAPALCRLAVGHLVIEFGARLRAAAAGLTRVGVDDFNFGHRLARRVLGHSGVEALFVEHEAATWPLFDALPALCTP